VRPSQRLRRRGSAWSAVTALRPDEAARIAEQASRGRIDSTDPSVAAVLDEANTVLARRHTQLVDDARSASRMRLRVASIVVGATVLWTVGWYLLAPS